MARQENGDLGNQFQEKAINPIRALQTALFRAQDMSGIGSITPLGNGFTLEIDNPLRGSKPFVLVSASKSGGYRITYNTPNEFTDQTRMSAGQTQRTVEYQTTDPTTAVRDIRDFVTDMKAALDRELAKPRGPEPELTTPIPALAIEAMGLLGGKNLDSSIGGRKTEKPTNSGLAGKVMKLLT